MLCVQLRCVSFISRAILISFVGPIVAQMVITFHLYREKNRPNYRALHVSQQSASVRDEHPSGCHVMSSIQLLEREMQPWYSYLSRM